MKIVIIEDEPLTASDLANSIKKADATATITAVLHSVKEAVAYFEENDAPDLIFSDIQLGDGTSFEVFNAVKLTVPVVFCTAYNEYALPAFKAAGIDYLLKPFTVKTISAALTKYRQLGTHFSKTAPAYTNIEAAIATSKKQKLQSVLVYYKEKILPIAVDDIALLYLQNNITHLYTFNRQQYFIDKTLEEIEKNMPPEFYRANRQYLIHRKAVKDISHYFSRKLLVNLTVPFEEKVIISKAKASHFLSWLSAV